MKEELIKDIQYRELQEPATIEFLKKSESLFKTTRKGVKFPNQTFFKLTYEESVPGPFSLGCLAHFGIGLFLPGKNGR